MNDSLGQLLSSPVVVVILVVALVVSLLSTLRRGSTLLSAARRDAAQRIQDLIDAEVVRVSHLPDGPELSGAELMDLAYLRAVPAGVVEARRDG